MRPTSVTARRILIWCVSAAALLWACGGDPEAPATAPAPAAGTVAEAPATTVDAASRAAAPAATAATPAAPGDAGISKEEAEEAGVLASEYVVVVTGPALGTLPQGAGEVPLTFRVQNAGTNPDRYRLQLAAEPQWVDAADLPAAVEVLPGDTVTLSVRLVVPDGADTAQGFVRLTATSEANPRIVDEHQADYAVG